jgi:two-component system OmpR family response regulator
LHQVLDHKPPGSLSGFGRSKIAKIVEAVGHRILQMIEPLNGSDGGSRSNRSRTERPRRSQDVPVGGDGDGDGDLYRWDSLVMEFDMMTSLSDISRDQKWPNLASSAHILLVEDDEETADEIVTEFKARGYKIVHATEGQRALERVREHNFNLLILDRMLPDMDGLLILTTLRENSVFIPVLVLSALGALDERVRGLRAGGDDYLTKPFALTELVARAEALLRRPVDSRETTLTVGLLELDLIDRTARVNGRVIELLPREFKLLEYMMRRPGRVLTRGMLLEDVWNYRFPPQTNLVDIHIGKLRRKIDNGDYLPMIYNVRGVGFVLREPD